MTGKLKENLAKYLGAFGFAGLMAWLYISPRDFAGASRREQYLILTDALTVPGMMLLMFGCLVWVTNLGALDSIAYMLRMAVFSLIPGKRMERDEKYVDYVQRMREKRVKGYGFLFVAGGICMTAALVFMCLFYTAS